MSFEYRLTLSLQYTASRGHRITACVPCLLCSDAGGTLYKIQCTRVTAASPKLAQVLTAPTPSILPPPEPSARQPIQSSLMASLCLPCPMPTVVRVLHNYELKPWLAVLLDGQWAAFRSAHPCIALALALSLNWDTGSNVAAATYRKLPLLLHPRLCVQV